MLGIHRTTANLFSSRAARSAANSRPVRDRSHRVWTVECLEGRTLLSQFTVTNLDDSGEGSLRNAIELSNSTPGPNEIDFATGLSGTITLTSGELTIANYDVTIVGLGQNSLSISGSGNSRVFAISSGVAASLSGLTITAGSADKGGGIYNGGALTVNASTIGGNWAGLNGGGIFNTGTMTVNSSTISGNRANNMGGIYNSGTIMINASTMSNNSADLDG